MEKKNDEQVLADAYKNAEMGVRGIDCLLEVSTRSDFTETLTQQKTEYRKVMDSAGEMYEKRTHEPPAGIGGMQKAMTWLTTQVETMTDRTPGKMAKMMIQGSTMGITEMQKDLNAYDGDDERVRDLGEKLIRTEQANIAEMKKYL